MNEWPLGALEQWENVSLLIWEGLGHEDPCQVIGPSSLSLRRPEGGGEISWAWESDRPELEAFLYHLLCDLKQVTYPLCLSFLIYKVRGNNNNTSQGCWED